MRHITAEQTAAVQATPLALTWEACHFHCLQRFHALCAASLRSAWQSC